ncbi:type VI secretion protein EvpB [Enterobacter hormaechei]|nr:type VI secretion protein EvpB [Enterobacter hormaechei]
MSVNTETASAQGQTTVLEKEGVYASLFEKINLTPASSLGDINAFLDDAALSDAPAGERLTAAMQVFMDCIRKYPRTPAVKHASIQHFIRQNRTRQC